MQVFMFTITIFTLFSFLKSDEHAQGTESQVISSFTITSRNRDQTANLGKFLFNLSIFGFVLLKFTF